MLTEPSLYGTKERFSYTYDPYGKVLSATGTLAQINPLRYRGYYYDTETQLYYLQSRYYDPTTCRFINADSYASTGQGIIGNNMFAYCGNNPISLYDPTGMCSKFLGFLWKIDCGSVSCSKSRNYNSSAPKAAVIYDARSNSYFKGLIGEGGFRSQGSSYVRELRTKYVVEDRPFTTIEEFMQQWNSLQGEYEEIYILAHGYAGGLSCPGQSIGGPGLEEFCFWDLQTVSVTTINLLSCHGATTPDSSYSAAYYFAQLTGGSVWAVIHGKMRYVYGTNVPFLTDGGAWSVTRGNVTTEMWRWPY